MKQKRILHVAFMALCLLTSYTTYGANKTQGQTEKPPDYPSLSKTLYIPDLKGTTIDKNALTKNAVTDYKVKNSKTADQTKALQEAIDDLAEQGGGNLILPAGKYPINGVYMRSNVHLLVDKNAVLRPYWGKKDVVNMFIFDAALKKGAKEDFSYTPILDHHTTYCAMSFSPSRVNNCDGWEISRPTNGLISNCMITNACTGYGLCQLHGARNVLFKNIAAIGGITLRLETGANSTIIGIYDIYGYNIYNTNGYTAVMFAPHLGQNGKVTIENVTSISSECAVAIGKGFFDRCAEGRGWDPKTTPLGVFSSESKINNVTSIFGTHAQTMKKSLYRFEPDLYPLFKEINENGMPDLIGPSLAAVRDGSEGQCQIHSDTL